MNRRELDARLIGMVNAGNLIDVEFLVNHGGEVNAVNRYGNTPMN